MTEKIEVGFILEIPRLLTYRALSHSTEGGVGVVSVGEGGGCLGHDIPLF